MVGDLAQKADVPQLEAIEESLISQVMCFTVSAVGIVEADPRNMIDGAPDSAR